MSLAPLVTPERNRESHDVDSIRDRFLSDHDSELTGLRPLIARSWFRSRAAGVDATIDRGMFDAGRVDDRTLEAADTHLRTLDNFAADLGGYVSLTAPNGALVRPSFLRSEEEFPEGYSLLEESCGSNGEGLALEEGRSVWLAPEEHFREDMRGNWCFATLIRDPFHNRVRGVIGLTFPSTQVPAIEPTSTLLMLEGITSRIEHEIADRTSAKERSLLNEYLTVSRRRGNLPVIAMDGKNSLMNNAAVELIDDGDMAVVSGYAKEVMSSGRPTSTEVSLHSAGWSELSVSAVSLSATSVGAIAVIRPRSVRSEVGSEDNNLVIHPTRSSTTDKLKASLDGTSPQFEQMIHLAAKAVDQARPVAIVGEAGTGKQRLAEEVVALIGGSVFVDAHAPEGDDERLSELLDQAIAVDPSVLVVLNADELSVPEAKGIVHRVQRSHHTKLVFTAKHHTDATLHMTESIRAIEITVPPLRLRREDIPVIARSIAEDSGGRKLSKRLVTTLTNSEWPRNIDQLRAVISNALERSRGDEVSVRDIPEEYQRSLVQGRLSRLEEAELSELRAALKEAGGNRRKTAEILQIGRSTLYRRMDFFLRKGLDL
ncbi:dynein regulation protein LC7 [Brevibacterium permense]|uniref:sigma-54-dependent Fis family transcriptional regulator n=1 Tax=Brevibacterium permense TaxID=234834 RepID=UPI0021CE1A26|nr:helix-turn-helix domain-containing protein [Brevibacterium permense]MCU4298836.1 dynein regulation protein LC7 [Brevibacterium permense]